MKLIFLPVLVVLFLPFGINTEDLFYLNTWMGEDYKLFINDKELLENGFIYKFRTRYESDKRSTISDWGLADCMKSTIDGKFVPLIARYGYERGMPALIKEICGGRYLMK